MNFNQTGKLRIATSNSVYHLGQADASGLRTITREGQDLKFEVGVLLGPNDGETFLGVEVEEGIPLAVGRGMSIMPVPCEDGKPWHTSPIKSISNE